MQATVTACRVHQTTRVTYDKRGTHDGFIRGELTFVDGSVLHFREAVDVQTTIDCLMYTYQYMTAVNVLIFRYDNTGHHKKLNLPTYPHHKHDGSETRIMASAAPSLAEILVDIEKSIQLPI